MTHYLKTLVALVVALMAMVGVSRDANAGNGAAAEAQRESVEALFHLATTRLMKRRFDACEDSVRDKLFRPSSRLYAHTRVGIG